MDTELLHFLETEDCFIEAEARPGRMRNFIAWYNETYDQTLSIADDGVILLQEDANKWGLELRLYVGTCPPPNVRALGFTCNDAYRNDYPYRLNDNDVVMALFERGYRIGRN